MNYYIHIPLPIKLKDKIEELRLRYNWPTKSEPHITIIPPLKLFKSRMERELIKAVEIVISKTNPFPIIQKGVGYFGHKEIINIGVERTNELLTLHRDLLETVAGILEPSQGEFADLPNPHITITECDKARGEEIWQAIKNEDFSEEFLCDRVALLRRGDNQKKWVAVKIFEFSCGAVPMERHEGID